MKAIEYCKKHGLSHSRLESILSIPIKSDYCLSLAEQQIYPNSLNTVRKERKLGATGKKSKTNLLIREILLSIYTT